MLREVLALYPNVEVASFGGSVNCFVPSLVEKRLVEKYRSLKLEEIKKMCAV